MHQPPDPTRPRETSPHEPQHASRWSGLLALLSGHRALVLPTMVALIAIGISMLLGAPVAVPVPAPSATEQPGVPTPTYGPRPTPAPTATPAPTPVPPRTLVQPMAPPVLNTNREPARKPGVKDPNPSTDYAIVVDADSGTVLFQRNGYQQVAPASLTKIMTALLAIQYGNLSEHVTVDVDAGRMAESTVMGIEPWSDVTLGDLLYGLMLASGNDAALAIARYIGGSDERFVQLMNDEARWLGLQETHFANPHGLDESGHYSSPADMVALARYAMQYPEFRKVVATHDYFVADGALSHQLVNLNPLLGAYPWADGVKTGITDNAGRALVGTAVRDGHRVYVAFMKSENGVAADGTLLLDWAFTSFVWPTEGGPPSYSTTR